MSLFEWHIAPLWFGIAFALTLMVVCSAGSKIRHWLKPGDDADENWHSLIVSAMLALLGLLIAFTFSMASTRYETRRDLVIQEANAISTTVLRHRLLPTPERLQLASLMKIYLAARLDFSHSRDNATAIKAKDAKTQAIQYRIWAVTERALQKPEGAPFAVPVLQTTNEMFDLASTRTAMFEARVPSIILVSLTGYATISILLLGYGLGKKLHRHIYACSVLCVLVALSIALIIDLDQPRSGAVRISQAPLEKLDLNLLTR